MFTFKFPKSHISYRGRNIERGLIAIIAFLALGFAGIQYIRDVQVAAVKGSITQEIGTWTAVDFVESVDDFDPLKKTWAGGLMLEELSFFSDGRTEYPFFTWEPGVLHHSGDESDARYFIKTIEGEEFLFLEWVSGDVLLRKQLPTFYVMKRK